MTIHTAVSYTPTTVYTPAPSGLPHAVLFNEGSSTVYVGGAGVTTYTGMPVAPNTQIVLPNASATLYACCGYNPTSVSLATNGAVAQGGSVFSVAANGTNFTAGMIAVIEAGTVRQEMLVVSGSTTTSVTFSTGAAVAHNSGITFTQILPSPSAVHTSPGTS